MKEDYHHFIFQRMKGLVPHQEEDLLATSISQFLDFCEQGSFIESDQICSNQKKWKDNPSLREYCYSQVEVGVSAFVDLFSIVNLLASMESEKTGSVAYNTFKIIKEELQNGKSFPDILYELETPVEEILLIRSASQMGVSSKGLSYARKLLLPQRSGGYDQLILKQKDILDEALLNEIFTEALSQKNLSPLALLASCDVLLVREFPLNCDYMALKANRHHAYHMWSNLMSLGYPLIDAVKQLSQEELPYQEFFQDLYHQLHPGSNQAPETIFKSLSIYSHNEACRFYLRSKVGSLSDAVLCLGFK